MKNALRVWSTGNEMQKKVIDVTFAFNLDYKFKKTRLKPRRGTKSNYEATLQIVSAYSSWTPNALRPKGENKKKGKRKALVCTVNIWARVKLWCLHFCSKRRRIISWLLLNRRFLVSNAVHKAGTRFYNTVIDSWSESESTGDSKRTAEIVDAPHKSENL